MMNMVLDNFRGLGGLEVTCGNLNAVYQVDQRIDSSVLIFGQILQLAFLVSRSDQISIHDGKLSSLFHIIISEEKS